jgi:TolB-like protein
VIYSILNEQHEPLTKIKEEVTAELEKIVNKGLEKNPANRYRNMDEIVLELSKLEETSNLRIVTVKKNVQSPISRKLIRISGILVLLVAILLTWYFFLYRNSEPEKSELDKIIEMKQKNSVAIMYFENNTGDENFDYWRRAISDLLTTDLYQSKLIRVLSGNRLFDILNQLDQMEVNHYSSDILREVGKRGRVRYVLVGNFTKAGETFRINVTLQKAETGELIASEIVEGKGEQSLFAMVDELTRKIRQSFDISREDLWQDRDFFIEAITTSSTEAYKYYTLASKHFVQGDYLKCIPLYEKAVAIDSNFARAYMDMAFCYLHLDYMSEAERYLQKAFKLSGSFARS